MHILIISYGGVTEQTVASEDIEKLKDKVTRWLPELRVGRVAWQDFGDKIGVVSESGIRTYEIFETVVI